MSVERNSDCASKENMQVRTGEGAGSETLCAPVSTSQMAHVLSAEPVKQRSER